MAASRSSQEDSSSKRHFHWTKKVGNQEDDVPTLKSSTSTNESKSFDSFPKPCDAEKDEKDKIPAQLRKKLAPAVAVARLRSVITAFNRRRSNFSHGLGPRVVGTLFGYRRGHVHFAFQKDPNSQPAFLVELATPISGLVREMASGLVRIALECDRDEEKKGARLLDEPVWRTYCNGKKCGFATKRECGAKEWKILKAVEPISMGAGVLPAENEGEGESEAAGSSDGEVMYMRAKFERVVGSRDSEAFYMMNPDSNGAPELSIYLLRV